ncbi:nuclear transport factor 2 family protein [Hanstruepera marina]|uniref:nuclear transport factor 2 family protein n=1 Tax=Hanstruepera marina TaxID=2873265 RepID=UPI001CA69F2E|nr:nuclear transport factor 2 family protein [Hanstruepera marina]
MKKVCIFITLFFVCEVFSQEKSHLTDINKQIWEPFTSAFETFDYNLFASLHREDLIRVSGNGKHIQNKKDYIKGYESRWSNSNRSQTISFRFLERIANNESASERGIYKLTLNPNTEQEQSFYGKFHVLLKKENEIWKILVDYDSSENNTINEESYNNAFAINDYSKY